MKLLSVTLQNFKAIGEEPVRIDFKPITLLFGPNSAGKSTIIQVLHYAREVFVHGNLDPDRSRVGGASLDLGGFASTVHRHDLSRSITMAFELDLGWDDLPEFLGEDKLYDIDIGQAYIDRSQLQTIVVCISMRWNEFVESPVVSTYDVIARGTLLAQLASIADAKIQFISYFDFNHPIFARPETDPSGSLSQTSSFSELARNIVEDHLLNPVGGGEGQVFLPIANLTSLLPDWDRGLSCAFFKDPDEVGMNFMTQFDSFEEITNRLIVGPGQLLRNLLQRLLYLGPLREIPPRGFRPPKTPDESRWSSGIGAWDRLYWADKTMLSAANSWLAGPDRLNSGYEVEVLEYKELHAGLAATLESSAEEVTPLARAELSRRPARRRLYLRQLDKDLEVEPHDVGVGISQVVPVIVSALARESSLVMIEQPEIHVHPAMQVGLGDLFISQVNAREQAFFLIETHSEHLMLRLMRRIRDTSGGTEVPSGCELRPDQLSIVFCELLADGSLRTTNIRVDENGEFADRWPKGFFEERVEELM